MATAKAGIFEPLRSRGASCGEGAKVGQRSEKFMAACPTAAAQRRSATHPHENTHARTHACVQTHKSHWTARS